MNNILSTKPRTTFSFYDENLSYEDIQRLIAEKNTNRFLQGVVSLCKANPTSAAVVVYRAFEDSVLLVFGEAPTAVIVEGSEIKKNLTEHSKKNYIYIFTHVL
tara:strand:+ start:128 stop:436 length:309 start_codon:yes stop_codon:yes gene_type:complete